MLALLALAALSSLALVIPNTAKASEDRIHYSTNLTPEEVNILKEDFAWFAKLNLPNDPELAKLLGISRTSSRAILDWLYDRVRIVSFQFALEEPAVTIVRGIARKAGSEAQAIARNAGSMIFDSGTTNGLVYSVSIPGLGTVPVESPRQVGFVQISNKFWDPARMFGITPLDRSAARIWRIGKFLHEGRHSDRISPSKSLAHLDCERGAGECDFFINGPFGIEARFLRMMAKFCDPSECSDDEKSSLERTARFNEEFVPPEYRSVFVQTIP